MVRSRKFVLGFLGSACLLGLAAVPALNAGVVMVSPAACDLGDTLMAHKYIATDGYLYMVSWDPNYSSTPAIFYAGLTLPQGATLKRFVVYCLDDSNGPSDHVTVNLKRTNVATGAVEYIASVSTLPLAASADRMVLAAPSLAHKVVNNRNYAYSLEVSFGPSAPSLVQFFGAKIEW
jgi:hypothetical protein